MKVIAFYLPQFHTIPENDQWWGEGFTEWTNVKKAKPLFEGHQQPKIPLDNNYYNLLDDKVKEWQISLAKENNVYGFCFYHYWFGGKLMLERPIEQYLINEALDLPFCLCWANPEWTKIWAGEGSKVLIKQEYGEEADWEKHFQYLLPYFKDSRYIKEDGMPLLVIYSPEEIPCIKPMVEFIRRRCVEEGFLGVKLAYQYYVSEAADEKIRPLFDYSIRFQPVYALHSLENASKKGWIISILRKIDMIYSKLFKKTLSDLFQNVRKSDYDDVWEQILSAKVNEKDVPCGFVNWDNSPRRGKAGRVFVGGNPKKFQAYMKRLLVKARKEYHTDYVFVNAWNEWSEGAYLEPDKMSQDGYLKAIKRAVDEDGQSD